MSQPIWKKIPGLHADSWVVYEDTTGVYGHEAEHADEYYRGKGQESLRFIVHRFGLERFKRLSDGVPGGDPLVVIPLRWDPSWPHPAASYEEWFCDGISDVARSVGRDAEEIVDGLCSEDVRERLFSWLDILGYYGFDNADSEPLDLTEQELKDHWDPPTPAELAARHADVIATIQEALADCIAEARREGYLADDELYECIPADLESVEQELGRKPTREEWAEAGLPNVGSAHVAAEES
jgi:hypothetical protein